MVSGDMAYLLPSDSLILSENTDKTIAEYYCGHLQCPYSFCQDRMIHGVRLRKTEVDYPDTSFWVFVLKHDVFALTEQVPLCESIGQDQNYRSINYGLHFDVSVDDFSLMNEGNGS